jgi:hypothetical protein
MPDGGDAAIGNRALKLLPTRMKTSESNNSKLGVVAIEAEIPVVLTSELRLVVTAIGLLIAKAIHLHLVKISTRRH